MSLANLTMFHICNSDLRYRARIAMERKSIIFRSLLKVL